MKLPALPTRSPAQIARLARRRLLVRVRPLALAAAVALGATGPVVHAQTVITPLAGAGQTATVVSTQGKQTVVNTQSLRDGNAFSTYSAFQVGQGDTVKLAVPKGANWWVNIVRDSRVRVDGRLESRLTDGSIGGNILFVDSHGFAVGPSGQVDVGRLTFAAPSTAFVDGLLAGGGVLSGAAVSGLLAGQFERSATGAVDIQGRVMAQDGVSLMAGAGGGAARAVSITGQVVVQGRAAGSAVNLGDLKTLAPLQDLDGVIDITTPGSIMLDGVLISDSAHWRQAGAVRVVAGTDIAVGANAQVSASGAAGSGAAGGQVALFAHRDIANTPGATLRARGDGAGAGGAIEYSGLRNLNLSGMRFDAGSDTGAAGLVFVDPADAIVEGTNLTGGANFVYGGDDSLTVRTGAVINTRQVASGQDATNASVASTGNSGNIVLTAPRITVEAGALLDASVVNAGGSNYAAGDITLKAEASANWITLLGFANADASVDVAGTLKGGNVTLQAAIESSAVYDGVSAALTEKGLSLLAESLGSPLALSLAYTEATGNATVNVRETAVLAATKDLSITATADRSAGAELQVGGSSNVNLSAGFTRIAGTTSVDIASGATLSALEDISLVAASKTSIGMTSAAAGETNAQTGAANVASVVFAGSMSDVTTRVSVGANAALTSGGSTEVQAFHSGSYETSAEVTVYGGGTAGVVGALSLQKSATSATVDGAVTAGGDVRVMAMNAAVKNSISATAETAQEKPGDPPLVLPTSLELSSDDAKQKLQLGFLAMAEKLSATSDAASGGSTAETKPSALKLAGAMTWSESDHTTRATVGAGARVTAGGDAVVDAQTLVGQLQSVALSAATSETKGPDGSPVALSVAFNYADHNVTTRAQVGAGAIINAGHVAVNASTDIPEFYTNGLPMDWSNFSTAYANLMGGTSFLLDGFNTRVGATAAGKTLAVAGAVNLTFMTNDTRAWVDTGAKITTTANDGAPWSYDVKEIGFDSDLVEMLIPLNTYKLDKDLGVLGDFVEATRAAPSGPALDEISFTRSFDGSTVVRAENHVQTLHHAGGDAPEAGGSGTSVGGTFSMVDRSNTAIAGIADRAEVQTHRLDVTAQTTDWLVSISPTSGKGAGVAANGIASYNKLNETTRASISREALVTAPTVNVDAKLSLGVVAITGAVSRSENSGVGIGLAMNDVAADTRAYVGDNDTDGGGADTAEGIASAIQTGALRVQARTDGMVVAVGVAGASAGEKPAPDAPASPSTGDNLAGKAGTQSADEQAQLNGSDATMAPLDEASAPAKGEGTDAAAAQEPAASKPPSFSIAGAGAIVTNFSNLDTTALLDGAVVRAIGSGTSTVAVRALSDLTQVSVAGGGALSLSNNASTTFTAAIAGAVAIQKSDDDTTARIVDSTLSNLADQSGSLVLQALKSGERTAVATGISANLSKGSTTSVSVVGAASVTTTTDDTLASMENTTVTGDSASPTALGVQVAAYDRSRVGAGGGALSVSTGKGSAGIGAAISIVNASGSTQAQVSTGSITRAHDLEVLALSSQKVVGVGAVAGLQTSSDSTSAGQLMGSFIYNHIGNTLSAGVKNGAIVNLTGDLAVQAGGAPTTASLDALLGTVRASDAIDYEMASTGNGYTSEFKDAVGGESIVGVAGTLSVTLGGNASSFGLSYVHNDIQTTYGAELNGSITAAGGVSVAALSRADIVGVSAGVGATKGKFSGMGSASVNLIGQRTQALVTGGSVTAASLAVNSDTTGNTFGLAGNLSFAVGSGNGKAGGAAVAYTQTGTKTYSAGGSTLSTRAAGNAATIDRTTVNVGSGDVRVQASNTSDLMSVAASGAAADGNVGFAGTVTVNETADVTDARISASTVTAGTVTVQAGEGTGVNSARIRSLAGGVSASMGYSGALALGFNTIESTRSAQVVSSTLNAGQAVSVLADSAARIQTLSITAAGSMDYAAAGSSSTNLLNGTTLSSVENSTLQGDASSLTVHASQSGAIDSMAGAFSGSVTGALGGAVAVNLMGQGANDFNVTARLANSVMAAPVAVSLDARLSGSIRSVAASGSGAGTTAINGSITTNVIEADVLAEVVGGSQTVAGGAFTVRADNESDIASLAGTVSGAGTAAVGVAISVNEIGGSVTARVQDYTMRATGAVAVDATSSGDIGSVAAGVSGAGTTALAGSNTTNSITSRVLAQINNLTQAGASASLRVQALDSATIESFAGTVAGSGTSAGGAAFALNFLGRTATNADSHKLVKAEVLNSHLNSGGAVQVKALSTSLIESIALAVGGSGSAAVTGSNTTNLLEDEITAVWSGGSLNGAATSLTVQADDAATVRTLAGNVSGSAAGAYGTAIAVNQIGTSAHAELSNMTLGAAPAVAVDADLRGKIESVAASGAADAAASVNGSFTTNILTASVQAQALGVNQTASGGAFTVSADNDADIFSIAGTVSGSGGAAAGVAVSVNDIGGDVTARVKDGTLRAIGAVNVQATTSGSIKSVAAGIAGGATAALAGSNTTNSVTSTVLAQMDNVQQAVSSASLMVQALDSSSIQSFAGTVSGGGTAAGGAAFALNFLGRTSTNADSSKLVKAEVLNSAIQSGGAVQVKALSTSTIESMGMAVGGSGSAAVTGSNTTNLLEDEIVASWSGGSLNGSATSLTVQADDAATVRTLAGNIAVGGTGAVGAAIAVNQIGSSVYATLSGVTLGAPVATVVDADLRGEIKSVAASGAADGVASVNGSFTTNVLTASVQAQALSVNQTASGGAFTVSADNDADIFSLAGTISGSGGAAVGAAVSVNDIRGDVTARLKDSTLRATGAVNVQATTSGTIKSVAAGVAGGGTVALAGSNTTNSVTSTVLAQIDNVLQAVSSASLRVQALDSSAIQSFAGTVSGGGAAAGGAAFALNFLGRTATNADSSKLVKAEVLNSTIQSGGAVQAKALSTSTIESMGMAVGMSGSAAVTGSNTTNLLEDEIVASWSGGSLNGSATSLTVQADDAATVRTLAGNVSGSAAGAVGAAVAVNQVGSVVRASLSGATVGAAVATAVDADLRGEIRSVAASGAASAGASVNGSFTTNTIGAQVTAEALSLTQITNGGAFTVSADNDADIFSLAGTISGAGGAAVGVAVSVNDIGGDVTARVADSALRATGAVNVQATTSGAIESIAAGMAGGGSVALAGSNTTNAITSTVLAQLDNVNLVVNAASVSVLARDTSTIQSFAGTVAGGGAAGGGAALALNFLGRTATNADSNKLVKAEVLDSIVRSSGAVAVNAYSSSTIKSVGVAAGVSGTAAISGSNSTNLLEDEITASWVGSELISSNTLTVSARQAAEIDSLAGNVAGGVAAAGAAVAVNRIGTNTNASLLGVTNANFNNGVGHWTLTADDLLLSAESDNQINTIAVGMSAGAVGVQGSVAVSVIDTQTHATMGADAHVTNVIASDSVAVTANSRDRIRALAGAVGLGAAGVGAAGGLLTNIISSSTTAGINGVDTHVNALANGSGLTVRDASLASAPDLMNITALSDAVLTGASFKTRNVKGLAVQATSIQQIGALTAVAGGGAVGAAGASINVDQIGGNTRAYIDSAVFVNDAANGHAAQATDVMAANHAMVASSATALAIGAVGVSGAMGTEIIDRSTRAEVIDGAVVNAQGAVSVKAVSSNAVAQISAGAAGGALYGVAGSGDVVLLKGLTLAQVDNATVKADSIAVVADGTNASNLVAGSASYAVGFLGLGTGVGLSFTVNVSGSTVRAVVDDSTLRADGAVVVDADNRTTSLSASSSAAVGGSNGVAVGASVSVMEGVTEAAVTGSSTVAKRTLATGLLASANDAPVTINLASAYDAVGAANQSALRFSLNGLAGRVSAADAVVTVTDGVTTVAAVRQADGSYAANVSSLDDGVLMAQVVLSEGGVQKVSTTTLLKSTGKSDAVATLAAANLPAAQTRIATLSSFEEVDARNHGAVQFVLKSDAGLTADGAAVVIVSDGTRQVSATRNTDGSYTADVRSLGDGVLTALVTTPADGTATARLTFVKASGAASLSVTANETIALNHNAGQVGQGGVAGVGASANVVVGKSTVDATVNASSIRVTNALTVSAERDADIEMITATGGAGGLAGVSGAVGVLVFGSAPDSNANSELTGSKSTLGMVGTATQANRAQGTGGALSASETTALETSAKYDTQAAFTGASGKHRTSATVGAQSIVAGSLTVNSLDRTVADNSAGAVALGGTAGVSAGVAVTLLGGANHAGVSVGSMAIAGDVSVASGTRSSRDGASVNSLAVAGAGGFVGVGAAVSVASNSTANTAVLAGSLQAGGAVSVLALDESSMRSEAYGASAGALSVGVVTATAAQSGSVGTTLSGTHAGQGLTALAERNASVDAFAKGGSAGVVVGSGAGASASDSGTVSLTLASGLVLDAGSGALALAARANPSASTQALGVAVAAGAAVGASVAVSTVSTAVDVTAAGPITLRGAGVTVTAVLGAGASTVSSEATAGAGALLLGATGAGATSTNNGKAKVNLASGVSLGTSGDVTVSATDSMAVNASAMGIGLGGLVGLGVAESKAVSNSTVVANATGVRGSVGGSLQVSASGNESIDSDAVAGSGGVVAGAGASATVDHDQTVTANLGVAAGQTLVVGGRTTIDASRVVRYDAQTTAVNAAAMGASGAVTRATLDGSATARLLDGSSLDARSLRVLATNDLARTNLGAQSAVGGGGGVISGAGADVFTRLDGDATASIGSNAAVLLEDLLEVRAYNEMQGSSRAQMDVGGAIPIALVNTKIEADANADAVIGSNTHINVYGESAVNALSYLNLEANSVSKTYGLAAAAQGNAYATANVNNRVTVGAGSELRSTEDVTLLAGQDLDFNRNKHFVTARVDLFNHSAIPVSINPEAEATLNLNNALVVNAKAIRSGGTIKLGGVEGTYVVEGKGKVSDWTRDLGELVGLSSDYGSSKKTLSNTAVLNGEFEAGFGNKQRLVVGVNGTILESEGDVRYTITNEDLSASASAYVERLYDQLARYGDVPEVRAFVEAELSFYFATLLKEGLAEEMTMDDGSKVIVASSGVAANFLNIRDLRAGSGNIELFGNDVSGNAHLTARADSEIYIENRSPLNLRVYDMVVDANGGFAKYNGTYLMSSADIGALNKTTKTTGLSVDSIDTRGGGASQQLPTLTVKNTYVPTGASSDTELRMTAPDGTWADLREDQVRAPELRVNGWLYNKLGTVNLSNTAGSISVYAEDPAYVPRLDGKEINVAAGKNFVLSSPTISQSVGGSPESLYAVAYSDDQQKILNNLGITACGSARPGESGATTYNANCVVNGAGGVYATGAIFIGARYLNINGTVQSGQADYNVVLSNATVGTQITNWRSTWLAKRGTYLAQGKSSLIQLSGPLLTDSEAEINKQYANGTITATARATALQAMATRRVQPIVYYDAEANVLKVAPTNVQGGLVELVGSIINTGGGVVRALDGYARINIDNQTAYGLDLQGLDTGGDAGMIRITDLSKPIKNADGSVRAYAVTTYQRDTDGVFKAKVTEGTGVGANLISTSGSLIASPDGSVKARFNYSPLENSTYSWSAGYEYMTEKRYYLKTSSYFGFIPGPSTNWNSVDTYVKTANAMVEDVYVGTKVPVGGGTFSITTKQVTTDGETQTYYRSWRKCGFLCIKKTYYVDRRTEVGLKDIFTQRVAADHDIKIELVGYDTGALNVKSVGGIRLGGNITNASGTVSLQSTNGAISQLNSGAVVEGVDLNFLAKTGIGTEASPINVITGTGSFTAESQSGPIAFHSNSGVLRINKVFTTGNVWLDGDDSIVGLTPGAVHVKGNRIYLSAPRGSIGEFNADGSVKSTLNIDTGDSTSGGLSAYARSGVAIKETTGNLWVNQVATGGDVYLEAPGDLIDNNRNETRDERTETELLSLWDQAALQGSSAEDSRQLTLTTTRAQFRRYWSLRDVRNVVTDGNGNVTSYTADAIDPATYVFRFGAAERQQYLDGGITELQIVAIETARTQEVLQLHAQFGGTVYQTNNDRIITAVNTANAAAGKSAVGALAQWTDAELFSPLPSAVFSKSSTDTQTRIEEPNVVGNRVVLRSGGQIGNDDGQVVIFLKREDRIARGLAPDLTADERLAIMSAESDDMNLDRAKWTLTVVKKDTFNVLSNRLNVESKGFIYLGADTTETYTNGGTANLEQIKAPGEVRIKVTDSILSVANAGVSVIQAQKAVLEAAQGSIGSAAKPIQLTLANNATGTLVARASDGIWIHEIGDMRAADIYTPGSATLSATGSIYDARAVINYPQAGDRAVRSIEARELTLNALGGSVGESANPLVVKVGAGGVNATSALGYSVYLQGAAGSGLSLNMVNSGLDFFATATGGLDNHGSVRTRGSIYAEVGGNITGLDYTAGGGIEIGAGGNISGSEVAARTGSATLTAGGNASLTSLSANKDSVVTASGSVNVASATAGRDLRFISNGGGAKGVFWRAGSNVLVKAMGESDDISAINVAATSGSVTMSGGASMDLTYVSALGNVRLDAVKGVSLLNANSTSGLLAIDAGDAVSLQLGRAKGGVAIAAGKDIQASSLTSSTDTVEATSSTGSFNVQTVTAAAGITLEATRGDLRAVTLNTARGNLTLTSGGTMTIASAATTGNIVAHAAGNADFSKLTTTGGLIDLESTGGSLQADSVAVKTSFNADALKGALSVDSFTAASATLKAGTDLTVSRTGTTTGAMQIDSGAGMSLGTLTASAGRITATAGGAMTAKAIKATMVDLSAATGLEAGMLTSTVGNVAVDSASGSVQVTSAIAKTLFNADAVLGALSVDSFTAGSATLNAGTDLTISRSGTTTGVMQIDSGAGASLGTLTASAGRITATAGGAMTAKAINATMVDLSAATGLEAGMLTSTVGNVAVDSASGSVQVNSAIAKTLFNADAVLGALSVDSFTAGSATLNAGTDLTISRSGTTTGAMQIDSGAGASLGTLTASADRITATAGGAMTAKAVKAAMVDLSAGTGLEAGALTSTAAKVAVHSARGLVKVTSATAKTGFEAVAVRGGLSVGSFTAASATLKAGTDLAISGSGRATGAISVVSGGNVTLGTLASSAGSITADAAGAMVVKDISAFTGVDLSAGTNLTASALTSTTSSIDVESLTGSVSVKAATARTSFAARSAAALTVNSFKVAAGGALLNAGGPTVLTTGLTTANIVVNSTGNAALGTLTTSSTGKITATSTGGGLTFETLRAGAGLKLDATRVWSSGNAISGKALYAGSGSVDFLARSGSISIGLLSVMAPAAGTTRLLKTQAGSIKVSSYLGPVSGKVAVEVAGGTKTLPKGY